ESMLDQALDGFTHKVADILGAERASLFLLDRERDELWSKAALDADGRSFTIRIPRDRGIVGSVVSSGQTVHVADAYTDSRFDPSTDQETGFHTRNIFCIPLMDQSGEVFGAAQLLNKRGGAEFQRSDEDRFNELMQSMGVILSSWAAMVARRDPAPPE
ncbi:MAG: GAF domain-containing protein, partial [Myxococcota bacterium]